MLPMDIEAVGALSASRNAIRIRLGRSFYAAILFEQTTGRANPACCGRVVRYSPQGLYGRIWKLLPEEDWPSTNGTEIDSEPPLIAES